jgi:hypothetical protein
MTALVNELKARLKQLQAEADRESQKLQLLTASLAKKKKSIAAIEEVMRLEGVEEPDDGRVTVFPITPDTAGPSPIAAAVHDYLGERGTAVHYTELTREVMLRGVPVGGKNPSNTLLAHLSRDDRFYRPSRGTYALKEWNPSGRSVGARRKKGA